MLVQVRTSPKHRSTHITNYQSTERESYECDETSLTIIPMCPRERFSHYKKLSRIVLCYKKYWATLMHLIYFHCLLLVTNYLAIKLLRYLQFQHLQTLPCWKPLVISFCSSLGSTLLLIEKSYNWYPILVGHQSHFMAPLPGSEAPLVSEIW